jgi:hypothetical protein
MVPPAELENATTGCQTTPSVIDNAFLSRHWVIVGASL